MMLDRDLYKTKLCNLYQRGHCPRQTCSFAHGDAELRRHSGYANDRRQYRGGDLRDKLDRRHSPRRRVSPGKDARGHQAYADKRSGPHDRGHSLSMSPPRSSERGIKRQRMDVHPSDISDDLKNCGRYSDDDYIKEVNSPRVSSRDEFEEQLRLVESEINALNDKKNELEIFLQEKSQEANRLATRNSQLESTLYKEQEDHKRLGSKIKKFIKAHLRFIRAKEDVKKTEARLQKLVDEFPSEESSRRVNHGEESDVNVVSDGEPNRGSQIGLESDRNNAAIGIVKKDIDVEVMNIDDNESIQRRVYTHDRSRTTNFIQQHEMSHDKEKMSEEPGPINDLISIPQESSDREEMLKANKCEDIPSREKSVRDGSLSPISVPTEKVKGWDSGLRLPSTGMAAHAEDNIQAVDIDDKEEMTDALHPQKWNLSTSTSLPSIGEPLNTAKTFLRNLPTLKSISSDHYNKYKGDDEEVDVEGLDSECKGIDLNF